MKLIIAGGRNYKDYQLLRLKVDRILSGVDLKDVVIICGMCNTGIRTYTTRNGDTLCGADGLGYRYADEHGIRVIAYPADWQTHGKAAGPIRNEEMAAVASHAIIFWNKNSTGTKSMIDLAIKYNLTHRVIIYA